MLNSMFSPSGLTSFGYHRGYRLKPKGKKYTRSVRHLRRKRRALARRKHG